MCTTNTRNNDKTENTTVADGIHRRITEMFCLWLMKNVYDVKNYVYGRRVRFKLRRDNTKLHLSNIIK